MSTIAVEKNKQWRMECLMENLRSKQSSKSFLELAKSSRMNLLEKKYNIDAIEKQTLQTALDQLQNNITIKNRTQLVERLEMITRRQLSLKFTENINTNSIFISSDMFYLEILLDSQSGFVNDVKVHHECLNESESEPHLIEVLRKGDFIDFTQQLEGFQSIYQLNCESKIKSKALIALQALETDLTNIYNQENASNIFHESVVLTSSIGLLTKRRGGHPLKLTFFVRACEMLNLEQKRMDTLKEALENAAICKKNIGNSVTVNLEAATPSNKLQIVPLLIKNGGKQDGNYSYQCITNASTTLLPATFVLRLNKPFPIASKIIDKIKQITNLNVLEEIASKPIVKMENSLASVESHKEHCSLLNQIITLESEGSYTNAQKGLFVSLADQSHCYFISDNPEMTGVNVKSIQFTEPSHVTKIIKLLREQALFNSLIASCVRQNSKQDLESCYMFEVNVVSLQYIQIFIEHPLKETMVTVELDLSDVRQIASCKINGNDLQTDIKLENYITRVLQKTCSIPQLTRCLLKYWESESQLSRMQKRTFDNGLFGILEPKNDNNNKEKKDDIEKDENSNGNEDSFGVNGQDSTSFDICGINKNEIFFKTNENKSEKRLRQEEADIDIFDQKSNNSKISRMMGYDFDDDEDENMIVSDRNILSDELMHNENSSVSSASSSESSASNKKNVLMHKGNITPTQKTSLDVFEFNDPSPPHQSVPIPRQSPSGTFNQQQQQQQEKRMHDIEIIPLKNQRNVVSPNIDSPNVLGQTSITITPINNSNFFYKGNEKKSPIDEKLKTEKKKKRKREEGEMSLPFAKKKSTESLGYTSPSKKSPIGNHQMGKPQASFSIDSSPKIKHSMNKKIDDFTDGMDDLGFMSSFEQQQQSMSPLPSPQSALQKSLNIQAQAQAQAQANRKSSLKDVIDKLKSSADTITTTTVSDKKGEYQIKSSGTSSDGIKITFNKTKKSSESKSPKHTGLKPGVLSGPASKKSQSSKSSSSSSSSSQKLLFHKSNSSSSLPSESTQKQQSGKSSKKDSSSMSPFFGGNSGSSSNDMLKNMLNLPSTSPRTDIMKAFDKKFQIPKLSARVKSDDKQVIDNMLDSHAKSAPTTPCHDHNQSIDMSMSGFHQQQKFFSQKLQLDQQKQQKIFKSASSEHLYDSNKLNVNQGVSLRTNDIDFQSFLRTQGNNNSNFNMLDHNLDSNLMMQNSNNQQLSGNLFNDNDDGLNLDFIGHDL
ncbi:hypothetical protein PVAND_003551 [Polypedilum vanderplanki]|uniref:Mediator of RNA polymerase II transcription subunit 1 n=1 Tax=Polypedilum vanderplanki TaxID=319348 RepID=A0A9J6BVG6_POLVA|nr:hypothetical protein PVAND_003551 [Polypedilum vanderplanki]